MRRNILKPIDVIFLVLMAYLTHITIYAWFYTYGKYSGSPELQLKITVVIGLVLVWLLRLEKGEKDLLLAWRKNWVLAGFIVFALLSLIWTVTLVTTIYRAFLTLFVSFIAAYLGLRLSTRNLVIFLALTVGVFALASLFLGVFFPQLAMSFEGPYAGLWHGIFWHKIYLGATMALGYVAYLVIIFSSREQYGRIEKIFAAIMLVVCGALAILSDAASGLIVFVIQTGLFILVLSWLKWGHLVPRRAYWWVGGVLVLGGIFILTNLKLFFGLFNRSATMTGRVPLWQYLLKTYIAERPFFGYGFGAFWHQKGMMQSVQAVVGWPYPVRVSDNGYMDILLGLGVVGLFLLLAVLAIGFWRAIKFALQGRDLTSFFPFFILIHVLFINLSLSYFFENEIFIWFLVVIILFMLPPTRVIPGGEALPTAEKIFP